MSRIGRLAITIPAGVQVDIEGNHVSVVGPKGKLERDVAPELRIVREDEPRKQLPKPVEDAGDGDMLKAVKEAKRA